MLKARFPSTVVARVHTVEAVRPALADGADAFRFDLDGLLRTKEILPHLQSYLLQSEAEPKRVALELLSAQLKRGVQRFLTESGQSDVSVVLGSNAPHSYFPPYPEAAAEVIRQVGLPLKVGEDRISSLGGGNSKLGLRGPRWAIKDPRLFTAMAKAIFEAKAEQGGAGRLGLTFPAVSLPGEMSMVRQQMELARAAVEADFGTPLPVRYEAGIETASGALSAGEISKHADALEYGLFEMTEGAFGVSREDAGHYFNEMTARGLYPADPFSQLDGQFTGSLVRVGQYLAGPKANQHPGSLLGELAPTAEGVLLGAQAGIRTVTVGGHEVLGARLSSARTLAAIADGTTLHTPPTATRDATEKNFHVLRSPARTPAAWPKPRASIPEGTAPLEFLNDTIARYERGELTSAQTLMEIPPKLIDLLARPSIDPSDKTAPLAKAVGASPGAGTGRIALSQAKAEEYQRSGEPYVLVLNEVHDEVDAVRKAQGLISIRGGSTSHAAMVAKGSDVPCVMNDKVRIDTEGLKVTIGAKTLSEGDWLTLDGTKGTTFAGQLKLIRPGSTPAFSKLMALTDEHRRLGVLANADSPDEAKRAFSRGAEGVGLVRTEHMFYEGDRIRPFQVMLLSSEGENPGVLANLEAKQRADFAGLYEAADGKKVTVRLLDPPKYEFLPRRKEGGTAESVVHEVKDLAQAMNLSVEQVMARIDASQELDSLIGVRGTRLANQRPDIEKMQVRALANAWLDVNQNRPEAEALSVIVPMVSTGDEMKAARARIEATIDEVSKARGAAIRFKIGSMIETPRAALESGEIARSSDSSSYGTNDMTQLALGMGRNVALKFVPELVKAKAIAADPTSSLDPASVGKLIELAEFQTRQVKPHCETGVCGGQGGDAESIRLVEALGLDYVSVPPSEVERARLGAAQANIARLQAVAEGNSGSALAATLARDIESLGALPLGFETQPMVRQSELSVRQLGQYLNVRAEDVGLVQAVAAEHEVFRTYLQAKQKLDAQYVIGSMLERFDEVRAAGPGAAAPAAFAAQLEIAAQAINDYAAEANAALSGKSVPSTASDRSMAQQAWEALRTLDQAEGARGQLVSARAQAKRVNHRNDRWDNNHYTTVPPNPNETMVQYMRRVANDFLVDNDFAHDVVGRENIPEGRAVMAVAHRSGAIDRFVTPFVPEDASPFMYVARPQSPLDRVSKRYFRGEDGVVVSPTSSEDLIARIKQGFEAGVNKAFIYPAGTGTVMGEASRPSHSTARLAVETGADIVPVSVHDTLTANPFQSTRLFTRVHPALSTEEALRLTGNDPKWAADMLHTALQFQLGRDFRADG